MNVALWRVALLFLGSGACALVYQTAWLREFRLIFGASTPASAAVLAVFMAGLGVGSAVLGRRADRHPHPLKFYGQLEVGIALTAALTPLLVLLARHAYVATGGTQGLGDVLGTLTRLALSVLVLGVPTFLMGGTLPAAAKAVETDSDLKRGRMALLYGVNTLGAVTGALAGTFFLFEHLGNRLSLWLACGVNLIIALTAIRLGRAAKRPEVEDSAPPCEESAQPSASAPRGFVLVSAGVVGFAFLLMELVWYRMLAPLLGGTTFMFGLILAVALLGMGAGGAAYAWLGANRPARLSGFALSCLLEAVLMAVPFAVGDHVAVYTALLWPLGSFSFAGNIAGWVAVTAFVIFPAAVVAGYQFPMLIGLLGRGGRDVGRDTGQAYAWNTAGAIVGSLAGGFGLLPLLTAPGCWRLAAGLLTALGATALLLSLREGRGMKIKLAACGLATCAIALVCATGPTAAWRYNAVGAGRAKLDNFEHRNAVQQWLNVARHGLAWEAEGREVSVSVYDDWSYSLIINGKSDGNSKMDAGTQVMLGMLGGLLHQAPKDVFVLGSGTGSTAGWLGVVPSVERVDLVELEAAVLEVGRLCGPVNQHMMDNPRVNKIVGDGREILLTTPRRYDLIVSEPSNLYRSGVSSLFTREYYQVAASKLKAGGLFLQWLQAYDTDFPTTASVYATLCAVFPHVETWRTMNKDIIFVASLQPLEWDVAGTRARLAQEPFKSAAFKTWCVDDLEGVLAHYIANEDFSRTIAALPGIRINTDDRLWLEYSFARNVGRHQWNLNTSLREQAMRLRQQRPALRNGEVDWITANQRRLTMMAYEAQPLEIPAMPGSFQQRARALQYYVDGSLRGAYDAWIKQPAEPSNPVELLAAAEFFAEAADSKALGYIAKLRKDRSIEADLFFARYHWRTNQPEVAITSLESAFLACRTNPWPADAAVSRGLEFITQIGSELDPVHARRLFRVLDTPFSIHANEYYRLQIRWGLAKLIDNETYSEITVEASAEWEPHFPWHQEHLERRSACYTALKHPLAEKARRDFATYLANEPVGLLRFTIDNSGTLPSAKPAAPHKD